MYGFTFSVCHLHKEVSEIKTTAKQNIAKHKNYSEKPEGTKESYSA